MPFVKDNKMFQYLKSRYNMLLEKLDFVVYQNQQLEKQNQQLEKQNQQLEKQNEEQREELLALKKQLTEYMVDSASELNYIKETINKIEAKPLVFNNELLFLKDTSLKKILIVGFYGAPNTGDELMLQAILNKLDTVTISVTVMVADNPSYKPLYYQNVSYIHYPKTNMDINIIAQYYDAIVIGGGALIEDSFYTDRDSYKYNVGTIMLELSMAAIINKKQVYCLGLSSSESLSQADYISKLDYIISNSTMFSLRDKYSLETLRRSGIKNIEKISIYVDLAYLLSGNVEHTLKTQDECMVVGLVMTTFSDTQKNRDIIEWTTEVIGTQYRNYRLRVIPFYDYFHSDIVNMQRIISEMDMKERCIEVLPYYQKYNDVVNAFVDCDLIISMRYHASLVAMKAGVPAVSIVYDTHPHYNNKMCELADLFDEKKLFISYKNLSKENLSAALEYAIENKSVISHKTKIKGIELGEVAVKDYAEFFQRITNK